jgi:hypothetical protein
MIIARRVGAAVLAVAAVAVWFLMAPEVVAAQVQKPLQDRSAEIDRALSDYEQNNDLASSAPQQQVVNGWAEKDLLDVIAEQLNDANTRELAPAPVNPRDDRVPALAGLLVLGLALALVTTPSRREKPVAARASGMAPPAWGPVPPAHPGMAPGFPLPVE